MNLNAQVNLIKRVGQQEKLLFTKHLDTMLNAGIPITEAFETLLEQTKSPYFASILKTILIDVRNGKTLSSSLSKHPRVFDQFYISLVEVGETSGTLEESLSFLTEQLAKDYSLRKKVQSALTYPMIVVFTTVIMGSFISLFILPKLVDFFNSFDVELPPTTKVLVFFANLMKNYGILIFLLLILSIIVLKFLVGKPRFKPIWHALILKMPIVGTLVSYGNLARFARNFGTLIKSGVPISKSLEITANTLSNLKFKNDLVEISKSLTKGKNIGDSMKKGNYYEYPPLVSRMIAIGEKTGKLDETLIYLGNFYEDEVDDLSKNLSTVLEPILLIGIGLVVGFLALAIISPIYELTGSIRH